MANTCGERGAPMLYGGDADEMITHCPACNNKRRGVERMSLNLRLSLLQGTLDEVAAEAPRAMSIALIPVLAELAQINEMLAEPMAA